MRLIILFSILMFSGFVFAENYFAVEAVDANSSSEEEAYCEQLEKDKVNYKGCFDITDKDMRRWKVGLVDDFENPKYSKRGSQACSDFASCNPLYTALDCSGYAEESYPVMVLGYTEVYCAEPNGYNQKYDLVPNPEGIIAADKEDSDKATDKSKRKTKQDSRDNNLESCAKNENLSALEQKDCIRAIAKELVKGRLLESEL